MSNLVPYTALAVTAALALYIIPRHPRVREWRRQREERRILALDDGAAAAARIRFSTGRLPHHEDCMVPDAEALEFARIAGDYDFAWIALARPRRREGEGAVSVIQSQPLPVAQSLGGPELAQVLGISYAQLWRWTAAGHLRPVNPEPGSGNPYEWPEAELEIARRMGRLTAAGLPLSFAATMARDSWPAAELADGITVTVTDPEETS